MKKLLASALATLLLSTPAFADRDHDQHGNGHDRGDHRDDRHDKRGDERWRDDGRDHPPGPPAYGWYKDKNPNHPKYRGHSGVVYVRDYGVRSGRCNLDEIGTAIGATTGVIIGGQVAGRDDRVVGMIVGGVLGAVLGNSIGDTLDKRDRACMGHTLELGAVGVPVRWRHDGRDYRFTPGREARDGCRYATLLVDGRRPREVLACPAGRGDWTFRRP